VEHTSREDRVIDGLLLLSLDGANELTCLHTIVHDTHKLLPLLYAALSKDVRDDGDARASERLQTQGLKEEDLCKGVLSAIKVCAESVGNEAEAASSEHGGEKGDLPVQLLRADKVVRQIGGLESKAVTEYTAKHSINTASSLGGQGPRAESVRHDGLYDGAEKLSLHLNAHVAMPNASTTFFTAAHARPFFRASSSSKLRAHTPR